MYRAPLIAIAILQIFLCSCCKSANDANLSGLTSAIYKSDSITYAKGFSIEIFDGYKKINVYNPWNDNKLLQTYILVPKKSDLPKNLPKGIVIRTPLEKTASYNSVQCSYFDELGVLNTLVGVCEPNQIRIASVVDAVRNRQIADFGMAANPDIEKIMLAEPEALFVTPIEGAEYGAVTQLGIPMVECLDYMENSPLGRAEWIRFIALFFEKNETGDSLFSETVRRYDELRNLSEKSAENPTVFSETMYGGVWYLPGGQSYMAQLFHDAGAEYVWKDDKRTGSLGLPLEAVLDKANDADFWLIKYSSNNSLTYKALKEENSNYALFNAYQKKNIFACNTGQVPYYEEIALHPDRLLKDLLSIFHPELAPDYKRIYFEKID